jgi:SHS2 domain-containing protein
LFDHTADVGIEAFGSDAGAALANAGLGLAAVVLGRDPRALRPQAEMTVEVEAPDREALVVAFLSELLWRLERDGLLWISGGVEVEEGRARGKGNAVRLGAKHGAGVEVKAVTYHELRFEPAPGGWRIRVILDI